MYNRLKVIGIIVLGGFIVGILANVLYYNILPFLANIFPAVIETGWLLWGIIGAVLSMAFCVIYAFLPE